MEFLRSFLRRHLAGKPMVASPNIGVFAGCPILEFSQGFTSSRLWAAINLGERRERTELVSNEGLNGVYRQPSKGLKINRQPAKMEVKINLRKVSKYSNLTIFQLFSTEFRFLENF